MSTSVLVVCVVLVLLVAAAPLPALGGESPAKTGIEVVDESFKAVLCADSVVRRIGDNLKFTEGPVWYAAGKCLLFSDIPADRIYQWTEADGLKVWREPSHNANGNACDVQGRLVSCEHGSRTVTRTGADGKVETICSTHKGKRLNSPNDLAVRRDGTIWFTDPPYGVKPDEKEQDANHVFRLDPGAKEPVAVVSDFSMPNGICFSPDQTMLYVADSGKPHHVRRFKVKADNTLEGGEVFATIDPGVPDGMRCDRQGRLYSSAADGVQVFSPEGKLVARIRTPEPAANLAFGGSDYQTLFITARTGLYAVKLAVPGAK